MWIKTISCVVLVMSMNDDGIYGKFVPLIDSSIAYPSVYPNVQPMNGLSITKTKTKNVTIHRNGFGRVLGLLKLFKGKRQCNISNPCVISKLWRASFQLEVNPHSIHNPNIIDPSIIDPSIIDPSIVDPSVVDPSVVDPSIVDPSMIDPTIDERDKVVNAKLGNNRPLPNIGSIFRFGNKKPQSSVTVGGSNQIMKDAIPNTQNAAIDAVTANDTVNKVTGKSDRVLRHAIRARIDEDETDESDVEETTTSSSSLSTDESGTDDTSMPMLLTTTETETLIPQTTVSTESLIPQTTVDEPLDGNSILQAVTPSKHQIVPVPTKKPESSTTKWPGYYDDGIHKPEFIQSIEFTTDHPPQLVKENINYVAYETPFKPSYPDLTGNAYAYSTDYFNAFKR